MQACVYVHVLNVIYLCHVLHVFVCICASLVNYMYNVCVPYAGTSRSQDRKSRSLQSWRIRQAAEEEKTMKK